jgi:hypothetical protein
VAVELDGKEGHHAAAISARMTSCGLRTSTAATPKLDAQLSETTTPFLRPPRRFQEATGFVPLVNPD